MAAAAQDSRVLGWLRSPFSLTPGFEGPEQPSGNKPMVEEALGQVNGEGICLAPFVMAAINTKNVHRSNFLLSQAERRRLRLRRDADHRPRAQGRADRAGPSQQQRDSGFYDLLFLGEDTQGKRLRVGVKVERDPGYGSTSKMIAQSAVCLLRDAGALPGGLWTPAPAMAEKLVARLQAHARLSFAVED